MRLLSIETSCDETAASIVESSADQSYAKLLSHSLATSLHLHAQTGGIIPESAARAQIQYIIPVIYEALEKAGISWDMQNPPAIDGIAITYGPGLIGSLLVGVETAKTLSYVWNRPLIPVNHLFGHIYANWIQTADDFTPPMLPAIVLVVSGGHTDLLLMKSHTDITWLGGTRDDAAGECFDKCARLLGYNYPGGPRISELAAKGDPKAFPFSRPMIGSHDFEFSFSGLKTAFINTTRQHFPILRTSSEKIGWEQIALEKHLDQPQKQTLYDLCASLQQAIIDVLVKKTVAAAQHYNASSIVISGGVAANDLLKEIFTKKTIENGLQFFAPPKYLCTDNAAMIGAAGFFRNQTTTWQQLSANPQLYFD